MTILRGHYPSWAPACSLAARKEGEWGGGSRRWQKNNSHRIGLDYLPHWRPFWSRKHAGCKLHWPAVPWRSGSLRTEGQTPKDFSQALKGSRRLTESTTGLQMQHTGYELCVPPLQKGAEQTVTMNSLHKISGSKVTHWNNFMVIQSLSMHSVAAHSKEALEIEQVLLLILRSPIPYRNCSFTATPNAPLLLL